MEQKLAGRRMAITGAASGIGRAIAGLFAEHGASLALLDLAWSEGAEVPAGARTYECDVADRDAVDRIVPEAANALGGLDGVVNAAGILDVVHFAELAPESWDRMLAVNLTGPFNICKAALPFLRAAGRATIVNIASVSAAMPMAGTAGYSASKAGVAMLTKCLGFDLGPEIRANAISPGTIQTEMTRYLWENPELNDRAVQRAALKRLGEPGDIAKAALFLSSEDSAFVTGVELLVDGGFSWR